jgi:hypothetical protein
MIKLSLTKWEVITLMKANFDYVPEMAKSELYLTFNAKKGTRLFLFLMLRSLMVLSQLQN